MPDELPLAAERAELVDYSVRMLADELTVHTSGNLSVRRGDLLAITPSGIPYPELTPERICVVDLDGYPVDGELRPSSELPMHLAIYRATDAAAVVHTHPLYGTALSVLIEELPPIHYLIALLGGPVRVAPYARYGSTELAEAAVLAMADRYAVLMRNHGATTHGATLAVAYQRSLYLEWLCRLYHQARMLGEPRLLSAAELAEATDQLGGYGQ
jgi:L-fuculose-phosphate aldolase